MLGTCLRDCCFCIQTTHDCERVRGSYGFGDDGQNANLARDRDETHREDEIRGKDADDSTRHRFERRHSTDDVRPAAEVLVPRGIRQEGNGFGARFAVQRLEVTTGDRPHTKNGQKVGAHRSLPEPHRFLSGKHQRRLTEVVCSDTAQRRASSPPRQQRL
jgi:hypothetical protein